MKIRFIFKLFLFLISLGSLGIILFSALLNIYKNKELLVKKSGDILYGNPHAHKQGEKFLVNPLTKSEDQLPVKDLTNLKIDENAYLKGQWSAPFDWNVMSVHSVLLPDEKVLTFGSLANVDKQIHIDHSNHGDHNGHSDYNDPRANKLITLSDGRIISRDKGDEQWNSHEVNISVDFDLWTPSLGYSKNSHKLLISQNMDSFCTLARVIDRNTLIMVGGNNSMPQGQRKDSQRSTQFLDLNDFTFKPGKELKHPRWYGSVVRTGDEKLIILGGENVDTDEPSIIPEILDLNSMSNGWRELVNAESSDLFGDTDLGTEEWWYPRSYLASDGNIVGISYNKIWMMNKKDDYRIYKTGEIPLTRGGISNHLVYKDANQLEHVKHAEELKLLTIGSPVGNSNSTVMVGKDIVYVFGGKQSGDEYAPSNKVYQIDFSNTLVPKVIELNSTSIPRSNGDATILPNGEVFLNGGHSYNDLKFSIFVPEIYNVKTQKTKELSKSYFRRNYHSSALLLTNGTILVSGGDVWNSEIFYPPYLFTKDVNNRTVLAKRPVISKIESDLKRGLFEIELDKKNPLDIDMVSIISTGSYTHAQGSEPKFRSLKIIRQEGNKIYLEIPSNKNELQNGTYTIFAVTRAGVPSVGKIIFLS